MAVFRVPQDSASSYCSQGPWGMRNVYKPIGEQTGAPLGTPNFTADDYQGQKQSLITRTATGVRNGTIGCYGHCPHLTTSHATLDKILRAIEDTKKNLQCEIGQVVIELGLLRVDHLKLAIGSRIPRLHSQTYIHLTKC
ncbi:hypothetical protein NDU88_000681 [Pleurodeles waltl]|uniref:Uncharacterized protein n=1 Tax=Pleurodeles waltl TaxID=8319 RepID=A0AAV7R7Z9_PLEWA|nr:hypothetical protein NDU88_000681 [Pleurodeles waltl]